METGRAVGKLLGIAIKSASRAPMLELNSAQVTAGRGLVGDYRGRARDRQITVLSQEAWQAACAELGVHLPWTTRRANLLVEGIQLENTTGDHLRIGDVVLEITGETRPCERMDEAASGLRASLKPRWRGGVTCRVVEAGEISVGVSMIREPVSRGV